MTSKLVSEAIRVYSYQLAREWLENAVLGVKSQPEASDGQREKEGSEGQIQNENLTIHRQAEDLPGTVEQTDAATLLLTQQLAEKEALIQQLRSQLESLQQQMNSMQRASVPASTESVQPVKRRMRSLHQVRDMTATGIKVNEEDVDSCSDKVFLSRKSSLESIKSHRTTSSREMPKEDELKPIADKTPSLCDLQVHQVESTMVEKGTSTAGEQQQSTKPNIFNVEYEEFAQQLKFELSPSTPSEAHKTPDEFISPDFRRRDSKPVMNWSNLPSPRDTSGTSLQPDSLTLKESEKPGDASQSIWTEMKPKPKAAHKHAKPPKPESTSINLDLKVRAKSQSHASKQGKARPSDEVVRRNRPDSGPRSAGMNRGRRSTPGSKGYSPKAVNMNQTTINFPTTQKEIKPSSSFRQRKFSSKARLPDDSALPPTHPRKVLDELLYNQDNSTNWSHLMQQMKDNPSFLSKLLNEDSQISIEPTTQSNSDKTREHKLVFTKITPKPVKAVLPLLEKWGSEASGRDLNCVLEEDEDSSRSHMDPLPELSASKMTNSFRNESTTVGPMLRSGRKQPTSAPKPRTGSVANTDWSESSLDSFVLGGTTAFNWDKRPSVFTEREIDTAYLKLHGNQIDPGELKSIISKGRQTVSRLMDELMMREEVGGGVQSVDAGVGVLKQVKRLLAFRKATVKILDLIHQREDHLLTLMSIEDEESSEGEALARSVSSLSSELLSRISQWKAMGFPFKSFRYLNSVRITQDYAQKIEEEATSQFSMKHFGFP